jgi:hypothetical protein
MARRDLGSSPASRVVRRHGRSARGAPSWLPHAPERSTILFLAANPAGTSLLRLDEEAREIAGKVRGALHRDSFSFQTWWALRPGDLQQALLDEAPTVVHFSGHGGGEDGIVLHGAGGSAQSVSADALRELFLVLKDNIRVVVLNACCSDEQAGAIVDIVDVVIGMPAAVSDDAARVFAAAFYRALGAGRSVGQAFDLGVNAIRLEGLYSEDEAPALWERPGVHADALVIVAPRDVPREGAAAGGLEDPLPSSPRCMLACAALLGLSTAALAALIALAVK